MYIFLYYLIFFRSNINPHLFFIKHKSSIKMNRLNRLLAIYLIVVCAHQMQLQLQSQQTCLDYVVKQPDSTKVFYFHYNHNYDNINMIIYYQRVKQIWHETGFGIQYKTSLQVNYKDAGNYTMCFVKKNPGSAQVSFQIIDKDNLSDYAGKQQLAKLSRRVSQFLVDIKRVGFTFKEVLKQHNQRKQSIVKQQNSYGYLLALKTAVMVAVIAAQILVIKKIFK